MTYTLIEFAKENADDLMVEQTEALPAQVITNIIKYIKNSFHDLVSFLVFWDIKININSRALYK